MKRFLHLLLAVGVACHALGQNAPRIDNATNALKYPTPAQFRDANGIVGMEGAQTITGAKTFGDGKLRLEINDAAGFGLTLPGRITMRSDPSGVVVSRIASPEVGTAFLSAPVSLLESDLFAIESSFQTGMIGDSAAIGGDPIFGVTAITVAVNPTVTTDIPHGFVSGQPIYLQGFSGVTPDVNGPRTVQDIVSPTTFTLSEVTTTASTYSDGGTCSARSMVIQGGAGGLLQVRTQNIEGTWSADQWQANRLIMLDGAIDGALGVSTDSDTVNQPGHQTLVLGINMRDDPAGNATIESGKNAWGLALERDYFSGHTVQHEGYARDGGDVRPFQFGYAQLATAPVNSIVAGLVTIGTPQADNYLRVGLKFKFTALTSIVQGAGTLAINTWYEIVTKPTASTFTFRPFGGGTIVTGDAGASGTMQRGGYGGMGVAVPMAINATNYDLPDVSPNTALQVINSEVGNDARQRIDNYSGGANAGIGAAYLEFNQKWGIGVNPYNLSAGHFVFRNLTDGGTYALQIDSGNGVSIGYPIGDYTPHTAVSALDVNGTVTATAFSGSGANLTNVLQANATTILTGNTLINGDGNQITFDDSNGSPLQVSFINGISVSAASAFIGNLEVSGGKITTSDTTEATSVGTGAIATDGGISAVKNLWIGGTINGVGIAATGVITSAFNQTQSTAQLRFSGTLLGSGTGASGTNSWPAVYHAPSGITAPTNWSTGANNGTVFGSVEVAGFTGNFVDFKISGTSASKLIITSAGSITADVNGSATTTMGVGTANGFRWGARGNMGAHADGKIQLQNNAAGAGVLFDVTTDGTLKLRTRADGADAALNVSTLTTSGAATFGATIKLKSYTVANMNAIASPTTGMMVVVTDSTTNSAASRDNTVTGSGGNEVVMVYIGGAWRGL